MNTITRCYWLFAVLCLASFALAADDLQSARLLYVPFVGNNSGAGQVRTQFFRIIGPKGLDTGKGMPLSETAMELLDWPLYKSQRHNDRLFPTGAEGEAVAFPAEGNITSTQGTINLWVKGQNWDIASLLAEELVTLESPDGNVVFGKLAPQALVLKGPNQQSVRVPINFTLDRFHLLSVTYNGAVAQIYIDGQPQLKTPAAFRLPAKITRIVLGQLTPGGKTNKVIDNFSIYNRPLQMSEINRLIIDELQVIGRKRIAVTKARSPITIDGIINPQEWSQAAQFTGLLHVKGYAGLYEFAGPADVAADQSTFWVTYDDKYIYIAHHSPPPVKIKGQLQLIVAMLQNSITKHDDSVDKDDNLRISFIAPFPNGDEYKIYVNHLGTTYDFYHGGQASGSKLEGIALGWESQIERRSVMTPEGWKLEMAVPWAAFYFGKPQPGNVLHMNFVRSWRRVMEEDHAWCYGRRTYDDDTPLVLPAGEVLFQGDEGIVVRLIDVGQIRQGAVDLKAQLLNNSNAARTVTVTVGTNSGEININKQITLKPGENCPFRYTGRIGDFRTHELSFSVMNTEDGTVYHVTTLPVLRKDKPEIRVRKYRTREEIKLQTNMEFLGQYPLSNIAINLVVNGPSGKPCFTKTYTGFTTLTPEFTMSTKGWPTGKYTAKLTFNAPGMPPYQTSVVYDRVPLPVWWNNTIGKELGVPYPWTALKVTDQTLTCWGRDYQWGNKLLPEQVRTQNRPILRAPMRLVLKDSAGQVVDTAMATAQGKWTKTTDIRVEGERVLDTPGYTLRNQLWSEYDGLVWCRITLQPKQKLTLNTMELEIPITKEFTDVANSYDYSLQRTGKLKPEGFTGALAPTWLGNGDGGIQWFCETDGWFFLKDNTKLVRVEMMPQGASLHVNMIDIPTDFVKPHVIEFGFIATPVRPKTYRTFEDPRQWGFRGGPGPWYPAGQEYLPAPDYYGGAKSGWAEFSKNVVGGQTLAMRNIYVTTGGINTKTEDFANFGDEWLANDKTQPADFVMTTHASKSYRDWFVWRHWKSFQDNPHQSLYYDGAAEAVSNNLYAGAGYVRRDGTVAVTFPILGARDIAKRMYNMLIDKYPFAWIGMHQSGMVNMAYMGFSNHNWDGENLNGVINETQNSYLGVLDPGRFRAEYMGHNFGYSVMFLGQGRIRSEWAEKNGIENTIDLVHGLCLLHDAEATGWQFHGEHERVCERTFRAIERHRLYHPAYQFVPYWHQSFVQLPESEQYASFYVLQPWKMDKTRDWSFYTPQGEGNIPKKVVMIVYNNSAWEGQMRLKPDWMKLGFDTLDGLIVENAVHSTGFRVDTVKNEKGGDVETGVFFPRPEEYARIENGELVFPMTKFNYRMIAITQPQ